MDRIRALLKEWPWWLVAVLALVAGVVLLVLSQALGSVAGVGLFSALLSLALIPVAVATLFMSLRLADRIGGLKWDKLRAQVGKEPLPAVIYLAARWIALALIISAVLR